MHRVHPLHPICRNVKTSALERSELSEDFYLEQGLKVLLHCRHGHHRTGVAIYLLLRSILEEPAQCLSLMRAMRPAMHAEILRRTHLQQSRDHCCKPRVSCRSELHEAMTTIY